MLETLENNINKEAKKVATDLNLAERIQKFTEKNAFVTLKDHKDSFLQNTPCRLINTRTAKKKKKEVYLQQPVVLKTTPPSKICFFYRVSGKS